MKLFFITFILFLSNSVYSVNIGSDTGLNIPRYVSLKSEESNLRIGPSTNYPINLKYIVKNYPVKILEEYKDWRKVIDFDNNTGWLHKSLIKGQRTGIVVSKNNRETIKMFNTVVGNQIGEIFDGNIILIEKCKVNWCLINYNGFKGWIQKKNIWGVSKEEIFNVGYIQNIIDLYYMSYNYIKNNIR